MLVIIFPDKSRLLTFACNFKSPGEINVILLSAKFKLLSKDNFVKPEGILVSACRLKERVSTGVVAGKLFRILATSESRRPSALVFTLLFGEESLLLE